MSETYEKYMESIECVDSAGRPREIHKYQKFIVIRERGGTQEVPGFARLVNENGDPVNRIDENTFKDVFSGETLKRAKEVDDA